MNYPSIIKDGQIIAKWKSDKQRRELHEMYLDVFRGAYKDIIRDLLFKQLDQRAYDELKKYIESEGITRRIIDETALIFAAEPKIEIEESKSLQDKFLSLLDDIQIDVILENLNKYVKLLRDVAVMPTYINGQIKLKIITPEKCFVEQNQDDPTEFDKFFYQVGVLENTPFRNNKIDQYHYWDITSGTPKKFYCEISDGNVNPDSVVELEKYPKFSEMPVVMFRDYLPDDSVWYKGLSDIIDKSIATDLRRTDLAMAEAYNIPQLFTNMSREDYERLKKGRIFIINAPPNDVGDKTGDAKYLSPNEQLKEFSELISERYEKLALAKGLSKSQISGESATSGYHLALSMTKILEINKRERKYYKKPIKKTLKLLCELAKNVGLINFPNNPEFSIDFGELEFPTGQLEKEQARGMKLANRTGNLIDFEIEDNPDLDRKTAKEIILERFKENEELNPNPFEEELKGEEDVRMV